MVGGDSGVNLDEIEAALMESEAGKPAVTFTVEDHGDGAVHLMNRDLDLHVHVWPDRRAHGQPEMHKRLRAVLDGAGYDAAARFTWQTGDIEWIEPGGDPGKQ